MYVSALQLLAVVVCSFLIRLRLLCTVMKKRNFRMKETLTEKIILGIALILSCCGMFTAWLTCLCNGCKNSQQVHVVYRSTSFAYLVLVQIVCLLP